MQNILGDLPMLLYHRLQIQQFLDVFGFDVFVGSFNRPRFRIEFLPIFVIRCSAVRVMQRVIMRRTDLHLLLHRCHLIVFHFFLQTAHESRV